MQFHLCKPVIQIRMRTLREGEELAQGGARPQAQKPPVSLLLYLSADRRPGASRRGEESWQQRNVACDQQPRASREAGASPSLLTLMRRPWRPVMRPGPVVAPGSPLVQGEACALAAF